MVFTFFVSRMLFIPYSFYQFASLDFCIGRGSDIEWFFWCMIPNYFFMFGLNTFWFVKMVRGSLNKLKGIDDGAAGTTFGTIEADGVGDNLLPSQK